MLYFVDVTEVAPNTFLGRTSLFISQILKVVEQISVYKKIEKKKILQCLDVDFQWDSIYCCTSSQTLFAMKKSMH